jgi:hypothetical protein
VSFICAGTCAIVFSMVLICANDPPRGGFFVAIAVTGATGRFAAGGTD